MSSEEDRHDLQQYRTHKDPEAARRLFRRYEDSLYGYLYRMLGHHQDTEDVLLRTFQKAFAALDRFEGDQYFKSWLFRIGHNQSINLIRRRQRRDNKWVPMENLPLDAREDDGFVALDGRERAEALHAAILRLPEPEREVVLLRLEANLAFREIAEQTGSPLGTVLTRMHRAKQRLRQSLRELDDHES